MLTIPYKELQMPSSAADDADVDTLQERVDNLSKKLQENEQASAELKVARVGVFFESSNDQSFRERMQLTRTYTLLGCRREIS